MKLRSLIQITISIIVIAGCQVPQPTTIQSFNDIHPCLKYGLPSQEDQIIVRKGYALGFRDKDKQPAWVQYPLTAIMLDLREQLKLERSNDFKVDPLIATGSAAPEDYKGSGYDRGHLAPAADMAWSKETMEDSFYMSNMSPQKPECNRKSWLKVEEEVRSYAQKERSIFIVTGPIFSTNSFTIGRQNSVSVPIAFYKAIYSESSKSMRAFIVPNQKADFESIYIFACSVDEIEEKTGLDLFSSLDKAEQDQLEKTTVKESF